MNRRSKPITGYMARALAHLSELPPGSRILDLPAGHGQLTDALRERGYAVTPADINDHRPDYVHADMTRPLPFDSDSFAGVVCLEGVEHMLDPFALLGELIRVARPGGRVVISTPNITNMYSRLQFLFTGTLYQFHPSQLSDVAPDEVADRFHVAPQSYFDLRYRASTLGPECWPSMETRSSVAHCYRCTSPSLGWESGGRGNCSFRPSTTRIAPVTKRSIGTSTRGPRASLGR